MVKNWDFRRETLPGRAFDADHRADRVNSVSDAIMRWRRGLLLLICLTTPRAISPSESEHSQGPASFLASSARAPRGSPVKTKLRAEDAWQERQMRFFHKAVEDERMLLFKSEGPSSRPPPDDKEARSCHGVACFPLFPHALLVALGG